MQICASDENDYANIGLKMVCIEYMRTFFSDRNFKVSAYEQMVPLAVETGFKMITSCVHNSEAVSEILDLYTLIVGKYAGTVIPIDTNSGKTVIDFLVEILV